MQDLWLLLVVGSNVEHGPKDSEKRRQQTLSKLGSVYENKRPRGCPNLHETRGVDGRGARDMESVSSPSSRQGFG